MFPPQNYVGRVRSNLTSEVTEVTMEVALYRPNHLTDLSQILPISSLTPWLYFRPVKYCARVLKKYPLLCPKCINNIFKGFWPTYK